MGGVGSVGFYKSVGIFFDFSKAGFQYSFCVVFCMGRVAFV